MEVTEAALDQMKQEIPIVFTPPQVFSFLAFWYSFSQCLTKLLLLKFSAKITVWSRNVVVRGKEKEGRLVMSKIIFCP